MIVRRRDFLIFLGASVATVACGSGQEKQLSTPNAAAPKTDGTDAGLELLRGPMPLESDRIPPEAQAEAFSNYEVMDDLVLPEGFTYDAIVAWGDKLGDSRAGYNNDYLSFVQTGKDEGFLTINFEYISGKTWRESYPLVLEKSLPFEEVMSAVKASNFGINAYRLPDKNPLKGKISDICQEALEDQGIGIIFLRRNANGGWERVDSPAERRISGISGLKGRYLKATGPGVAIFKKQKKMGYDDRLGEKIVGTFGNCAGGTTPWGTVLSAEENFQAQVPEPVYADGSAFAPENLPFVLDSYSIYGQGNVFGLAGNKYGYIVEVDPADAGDYGTKHTWLGRYRHEAVAVRAEAQKPLAVYSGCDRRGGHLYKFVSKNQVSNPEDKANSRLLEDGMLYAAIFEADGTGRWIALKPETPINPVLPSKVFGSAATLPKRPEGGFFVIKSDKEAIAFKKKYKTLGDLYAGNALEKQGAILIDAHFAANAVGATTTARPEDTDIAPDGQLYIAFTSGLSGRDDGPDKRIFKRLNGQAWEYGWIMRLMEDNNDPASMTFRWEMLAMGGEPALGGAGFSNPDNLLIDRNKNIWMVTDISTTKHNNPLDRSRRGYFGNNSIWVIPTSGETAGDAYLFGIGPMECEICGPFFSPDQKTLFLAVQHPGEISGTRQNGAHQLRKFLMKTTEGQDFVQERLVPIGSNWPSKKDNEPPRPAVVAVRRLDSGSFEF